MPQLFPEQGHLESHEPAGKTPEQDAIVEAFEVRDSRQSAAITTWRPASMSAFSVGQIAAWVDLPWRNGDRRSPAVDAAQRFLEGERRLRLQRGDEAVHEFFGGEIRTLRSLPELPAQVTAWNRCVLPRPTPA